MVGVPQHFLDARKKEIEKKEKFTTFVNYLFEHFNEQEWDWFTSSKTENVTHCSATVGGLKVYFGFTKSDSGEPIVVIDVKDGEHDNDVNIRYFSHGNNAIPELKKFEKFLNDGAEKNEIAVWDKIERVSKNWAHINWN